MIIDHPTPGQIPQLRGLWKEAFGDTDAFLNIFFRLGFAPARCRCVTEDGTVTAALYWFDCQWEGSTLAYIYAVATAKSRRGQGLCRKLLADTHAHLAASGYRGSLLVPGGPELFAMYEKLGYRICSHVTEFSCAAGGEALPLTPATPEEYAAARKALLPPDSVLQEGVLLDFLAGFANLYTGPGVALATYLDGEELVVCELLGAPETAPKILSGLGLASGKFRIPGQETPYGMYCPLTENTAAPGYLGLALN